jgi:hypothetical protein
MRLDQLENPNTDLHILAEWLRNRKLDVEFLKHPMMKEWEKLEKEHPDIAEKLHSLPIMSPNQLHVRGPHGVISVIRGGVSMGDYEIYSLEGELFDGIRRYRKVEHAGKSIHSLLTTGMFEESVPRVWCVWEDFLCRSDEQDGSVQDIIE